MAKKDAIDLTTLMGKQSRTYQTRTMTDEMVASRSHIAIALWDIPWLSAPHGKLHGWVMAFDCGGQRRFVRTGTTMEADPVPVVLEEFKRALRGVPKPIWIVVGRRQTALGSQLRKLGYKVTGSFAEENRASVRARNIRNRQEKDALKRSRREGEAPKKQAVEKEVLPTHWLPFRRKFKGTGTQVRIATDASSDTVSKGSMCFVASNGDYQLKSVMTKAGTDELELNTITMALRYATKRGFTKAIIESDSVAAVEAVDHILGERRAQVRALERGRRWRGVSSYSRKQFLEAWNEYAKVGHATIGRVMGHAGDPLNHAADRIAYLGLRASNHPEEESKPTAWKEIDNIIRRLEGHLSR